MTAGNFLANYGGKLWGFISIYIFVPIYIRFLGIESYGIISVYSLVIAIIGFIDSGFSSSIIKEFSGNTSDEYRRNLLYKIERFYIVSCLFVSTSICMFSSILVNTWFKIDDIPSEKLSLYIKLIGIGVPLQLLSSLYFGALIGLQQHITANYYQIIWNVVRSSGVVALFFFYKSSLEVFFIWQIFSVVLYLIVIRWKVFYSIRGIFWGSPEKNFKIDGALIKYICGVTLMAIISSISSQADKVITSSFLSLKQFGLYSVAGTIAQIPLLISTPFATTVFPTLSFKAQNKTLQEQSFSFITFSLILNPIILCSGIYLYLYMDILLKLWMGEHRFSTVELNQILFIGRFLVVGSSFIALQLLSFYTLMSKGKTKFSIIQSVFQVVIGLPLMFFLIRKIGLLGVGLPYVLINICGFMYIFFITVWGHFRINLVDSMFKPFVIPLLIILTIASAAYFLSANYVLISRIIIAVVSAALSLIVSYITILDKSLIKSALK